MALGQVDDHGERLVDDGEVLILVEDFERDVLRRRLRPLGLGQLDRDAIADARLVAGPLGDSIDGDAAGLDRPLNDRAAEVGELQHEVLVEAQAEALRLDLHLDRSADRRCQDEQFVFVVFR